MAGRLSVVVRKARALWTHVNSQIRSTNSQTNPKSKISMPKQDGEGERLFGHWKLELAWILGFEILRF
jgi:hypothetical protein